VSPVTNLGGSQNIPPHSTGAAIDIYLVDEQGKVVDMGISTADWMKDVDGSISQTDSSEISDEAKHHRLIMSHALEGAGFVNYPGEIGIGLMEIDIGRIKRETHLLCIVRSRIMMMIDPSIS